MLVCVVVVSVVFAALVFFFSQEELVASLQIENQALQAALERLRLDFHEERGLREKEASEHAAKGKSKLGILGMVSGRGRRTSTNPHGAKKEVKINIKKKTEKTEIENTSKKWAIFCLCFLRDPFLFSRLQRGQDDK